MNYNNYFLTAIDGHHIPVKRWRPAQARSGLVIAHGMAEHAGRYKALAEWLNGQGVSVVAVHHRGHGPYCSSESLGHFADQQGWQQVIGDLLEVVRHSRLQAPGVPLTLFGHSMGSFIAQAFAQQYGEQVDQLVLCATNRIQKPKLRASAALLRMITLMHGRQHRSPMIDKMTFGAFNRAFRPTRTSHDWLSRDPAQVDAYLQDPLCGFSCTVGLWHDFIAGMLAIDPAQWPRNLPVHLMAGGDDPVGEMGRGFRKHVSALRKQGVKVASDRVFEGARHELMNETNAGEVWLHLQNCLAQSHSPAQST